MRFIDLALGSFPARPQLAQSQHGRSRVSRLFFPHAAPMLNPVNQILGDCFLVVQVVRDGRVDLLKSQRWVGRGDFSGERLRWMKSYRIVSMPMRVPLSRMSFGAWKAK